MKNTTDSFNIKIINFQSLKDVKLSLVPGINIITGRTNQGKSAIIRAVDVALFNKGSSNQIKVGTDEMKIVLNNRRHSLVFKRNIDNKKTYIFDNGEPQTKVNQNQLPEVADYFNIKDIRLKNNVTKMKLNFWYQNDKPFLMDKNAAQLYEFLSISSCKKYVNVLTKMTADIKENNNKILQITTEIDTLKKINLQKQAILEKNKDYLITYDKIIALQKENNTLSIFQQKLERFQKLNIILQQKQQQLLKINNVLNSLNFDEINKKLQFLIQQNAILEKSYFLYNKINNIQTTKQFLNSQKFNIEKILYDLTEFIKKNNDALKYYENLQQNLSTLNKKIQLLQTKNDRINTKRQQLNNTNEKIQLNNQEYTQLKNEIGVCPYCLNTLI